MPTNRLLIQRFPGDRREDSECVDWLMKVYHQAKLDRRWSEVRAPRESDTPITMTRNLALLKARQLGFDFMLMVDSDMVPDSELQDDPTAVPFYDAAVDFALKSPKPCIIAAPYCGPPPHENVYVFQWGNRGNTLDPTAANARLDQYTREHAAMLSGIQPVGALPTGVMLLDLRVLDGMPHPWTYYEFKGAGAACDVCGQRHRGPEAEKASTEDVTLTRDLALAGVPIYCAWSSWAGHNKRYTVRKPRPYTSDVVARRMHAAIIRGVNAGEQEVVVQPPDWLAEHERELARQEAEVIPEPYRPVTINEAEFLRPERGTVGNVNRDAVRAHPPIPVTARSEPDPHPGPVQAPVMNVPTARPPATVNADGHVIHVAPAGEQQSLIPNGARIPVQVVGPDNVTRVVIGTMRNGRVVADASSTIPPNAGAPAPGWMTARSEPDPHPGSPTLNTATGAPVNPWEQHIPPAVGGPLTPADLLSGVPLG